MRHLLSLLLLVFNKLHPFEKITSSHWVGPCPLRLTTYTYVIVTGEDRASDNHECTENYLPLVCGLKEVIL